MNKKFNVFVEIIVVIFVVFGIFLTLSLQKTEAPKIEDDLIKQENQNISVVKSSKEITKDNYNVKFNFPIVPDEAINQEITKLVDDITLEFENQIIEFSSDLNPVIMERPYVLLGDFETYFSKEYISFVFLVSVDFGGAHPNHFYKTLTFNKDKKVVELNDFLNEKFPNIDALSKVSEISRNQISEKLGSNTNNEMLYEGTIPDLNNFRNFYITDTEIVFLFEPYAVAPYAYSSQESRVKFSDIF